MGHVLVGEKGNMGFAQKVDPDPTHPSWEGVRAFLANLPDLDKWKFYISPAATTRPDREEEN